MPCSWWQSNNEASTKQGWALCIQGNVCLATHKQADRYIYMMQDEEACRMKKQMKDIPETLQDKMGQKMRLTVNGCAVESPVRLPSTTYLSLMRGKYFTVCVWLCAESKPVLNRFGEAFSLWGSSESLTSPSSRHVSIAVVLRKICWLRL